MSWAKEQLDKLSKHCGNCPLLTISVEGDEEIYECELLADEIISEWEESGEDYESDGTEGILAIAYYDKNGELYDFEWVDSYPKSCPKLEKNSMEVML